MEEIQVLRSGNQWMPQSEFDLFTEYQEKYDAWWLKHFGFPREDFYEFVKREDGNEDKELGN